MFWVMCTVRSGYNFLQSNENNHADRYMRKWTKEAVLTMKKSKLYQEEIKVKPDFPVHEID